MEEAKREKIVLAINTSGFLGVRNKYCSSSARNIPADNHKCYRNWSASSSEMETDIILNMFLKAEWYMGFAIKSC